MKSILIVILFSQLTFALEGQPVKSTIKDSTCSDLIDFDGDRKEEGEFTFIKGQKIQVSETQKKTVTFLNLKIATGESVNRIYVSHSDSGETMIEKCTVYDLDQDLRDQYLAVYGELAVNRQQPNSSKIEFFGSGHGIKTDHQKSSRIAISYEFRNGLLYQTQLTESK